MLLDEIDSPYLDEKRISDEEIREQLRKRFIVKRKDKNDDG